MFQIIEKKICENNKEFQILQAGKKASSIDGKPGIIKNEKIGTIVLQNKKGEKRFHDNRYAFPAGMIENTGHIYELHFREISGNKSSKNSKKLAKYASMAEDGVEKYTLCECFEETSKFLWFRNGYPYYLFKDVRENKEYKVYSITFDADYHFYQIMDGNKVMAAIHKPYRELAEDEYHLYAPDNQWMTMLYFIATYMDNFYRGYLIKNHPNYDIQDMEHYFGDHEAYEISEDVLLELYDEEFMNHYVECNF